MSTGRSVLRGVIKGVTGVDVSDIGDDGEDGYEDGFDFQNGDIEIDEVEFQECVENSRNHASVVYESWNGLSPQEQLNLDPEVFAKNWLDKNVQNLSENTLSVLAGIIGGAIVGVVSGDSSTLEGALEKIAE